MIQVKIAHLGTLATEAVMREVTSELGALTPVGRELEMQAGVKVMERLEGMGTLPVGGAVITPGGNLSAAFIIHTVIQSPDQPIASEGVRVGLLNGLRRATEWGIETLGVSPMGCGAGNLDAETTASVMVPLIREHMMTASLPREVTVAVANEYEQEAFTRVIELACGEAPARDM
jgi:O-acetyl-ADP-ribose deacetylase (regulator of RNase III)